MNNKYLKKYNNINISKEKKENKKLCKPSIVYIIISLIIIANQLFKGILLSSLLAQILYNVVWIIIITWLCEKKYESLSWFLVVLPVLILPYILYYVKNKNTNTQTADDTQTTNDTQ